MTENSNSRKISLLLFVLLTVLANVVMQPISIARAEIEKTALLSAERAPSSSVLSYPPDPFSEIAWSAGMNGVADIQAAFNNARTQENNQLGTSLPMMTLPSQSEWNAMGSAEQALWLINRERIDRGVTALDGLEANVNQVAQYYADYLMNNDAWGHSADGRSPWQRLDDNASIGACSDNLPIAENLAVFATSGSSIALPVERSVYMWMYEDGDCCTWGHRHMVLWYPFNDNSGVAGQEGFLGIGRASGGPYQGPFSESWPYVEIIVMNVFDPCSTWSSTPTTFGDVLTTHPFYNDIEILYANGLTAGCTTSPLKFCPDQIMDRAQSAVFMMKGNFGTDYAPPVELLHMFGDNWSPGAWAEKWAEGMYNENLTAGCTTSGPLKFCPWDLTPREQAVIFGLKLKYGANYTPPPASGTVFADMTNPNYYATKWAEQAYADGLIPACGTSGGKPLFCPNVLTTRGLAAYIIVRAKNLSMP